MIIESPEPPRRIWLGETGPALIAKSGTATAVTWNVMAAVECDSVPLVPVTVTVKSVSLVTVALQDRDAVFGEVPKITLEASVQVRPLGDDADADRSTVPVKPFRAVKVMVWVIVLPLLPLTVMGDEGWIVKSTTWKSMLDVVCVRDEMTVSVPVSVTV